MVSAFTDSGFAIGSFSGFSSAGFFSASVVVKAPDGGVVCEIVRMY